MKIKFSETFKSKHQVIFYIQDSKILVSEKWRKQNNETHDYIKNLLHLPEIKKNKNQLLQTFAPDMTHLLIVRIELSQSQYSFLSLGGRVGKEIQKMRTSKILLVFPDQTTYHQKFYRHLQQLLEGILLGLYRYQEFKTTTSQTNSSPTDIVLGVKKSVNVDQVVYKAKMISSSTNLARDISNRPANYCTPSHFKEACHQVAKESHLQFDCLNESQMKKQKMGCLLGVSQGSHQPAFLNILNYSTTTRKAPTIILVGKGVTYDSGGLSLKTGDNLPNMKMDISGSASVLGAMRIIGLLKPDINVIGLMPAVENMPGGGAIRPGDVLTACNGKTIEVSSTDAEGRLILADVLAYGIKTYQPDAAIDISTLTGACVIALGSYKIGMISNSSQITDRLITAGKQTEEFIWEMPNDEIYEKEIQSKIADFKNLGGSPAAGMILGGLFVRQFVGEVPWAHLDMPGMGGLPKGIEHFDFQPASGATGSGARLLAQVAMNWEK
jgi:leucyl aminopeptidase